MKFAVLMVSIEKQVYSSLLTSFDRILLDAIKACEKTIFICYGGTGKSMDNNFSGMITKNEKPKCAFDLLPVVGDLPVEKNNWMKKFIIRDKWFDHFEEHLNWELRKAEIINFKRSNMTQDFRMSKRKMKESRRMLMTEGNLTVEDLTAIVSFGKRDALLFCTFNTLFMKRSAQTSGFIENIWKCGKTSFGCAAQCNLKTYSLIQR